ncbi:MAG: DUF58 domain-containing protein [Deltaproteobacteria bacterium]|nr:DUF58 domain-containing protein [Deltaproteobacteria bacterium]
MRRRAKATGTASVTRSELFNEEFLKKLEYLHIVSRKLFSGLNRAERRTRKVGSGVEFADYRDYAAGDDFRYLDWNVYGRMDRLLLRLFEEEEDLHIYFLLDTSDSTQLGQPPKLHYGMQIAAALAYVGLANLDRVSVVTFADGLRDRLAPARGKGRIFKVFEFFRNVEPGGQTRLAASLRAFVHQNKRRGLAVLISDFYDPAGYEEGLNLLRHNRFEPLVIHLHDPREARPSLVGDLQLIDCETGEVRELTVSPRLLKAYAAEYERYCAELQEHCTKKQIPFFRADTQLPFDDLVLRIFRRGGFLK